ncbi:MAG: AAA family ATPase [Rubripirellula sp.]|nr:AAA family ATPase [Rubripirellula sp.]
MSTESTPADQFEFDQLREQADSIRNRLNRFRSSLGRHFVDKQPLIDLMVVAAVAQEPLLLVGPPGTAKSDLVLKFKDALGISQDEYFEYMLTRFTEPSEIIGPIDINELRDGRYIRREQGKLPTAKLAFLDEIFKSNSAILNILLPIVNEKKFYQDGVPQSVSLCVLFAAANEIPEHGELNALKDRFVLKAESLSVQSDHFTDLIDAGLKAEVNRSLNQKPWAEGHASLDDLVKANRYLMHLFSHQSADELNDRQRFFPDDVFREFQRLVKTLVREDRIFVSDRKLVKLYKLFRVRSWLLTGGTVTRDDLQLLMYLGESPEEMALLREKVPLLLAL